MAGFGAKGIIKGSIAAAIQASYDLIKAGSQFATISVKISNQKAKPKIKLIKAKNKTNNNNIKLSNQNNPRVFNFIFYKKFKLIIASFLRNNINII